jgi:surfeit locus 1 family protein
VRLAIAILTLGIFAGFIALGTWQMHRRSWKLALIARVEHRVHAAPVAPPAPQDWPGVDAQHDEYLRVRLTGAWLFDRETLVHAATRLGTGYWVLTPLRSAEGTVVLINRGFVPPQWRERADLSGGPAGGEVTVTGLLRITEPGGGFLRRNDPGAGRWYSRDVMAVAAARGLTRVAPYFVDAEAPSFAPGKPAGGAEAEPQEPVAGMTVIAFQNDHLVYAITWYALALMVAVAAAGVVLAERRRLLADRSARFAASATDSFGRGR